MECDSYMTVLIPLNCPKSCSRHPRRRARLTGWVFIIRTKAWNASEKAERKEHVYFEVQ
jgi:hypothetical protein